MSKRELIDRIRLFNPSAASSFLAQFGEPDLNAYLRHLEDSSTPVRRRPALQPPAAFDLQGDPRQLALTF